MRSKKTLGVILLLLSGLLLLLAGQKSTPAATLVTDVSGVGLSSYVVNIDSVPTVGRGDGLVKEFDVAVGKHDILIEANGYSSYINEVVIKKGKNELKTELIAFDGPQQALRQALDTEEEGSWTPVEGSDDTYQTTNGTLQIKNAAYFKNNTWLVARVVTSSQDSDGEVVVLQLVDGVWQIIASGTGLSAGDLSADTPQEIATYITYLNTAASNESKPNTSTASNTSAPANTVNASSQKSAAARESCTTGTDKQACLLYLRSIGAYFVQPGSATTTASGAAAGSGSCYELAFPQVNDLAVFSKAIDDYIREKRPASPFVGLGSDIVLGSQRQGVNPMFIIGNMRMESQYGTSGTTITDPNTTDLATLLHRNYNAFGRTAGASQPNFASSTGRLWYKYPSWKESVNNPAASPANTVDQPSIMRKAYLDGGIQTISQYLSRYAPASDGNDESTYGRVMKDVIGSLVAASGPALSCTDAGTTLTPGSTAPAATQSQSPPSPNTPTGGASGKGTVAVGSYKKSVRQDWKSYMVNDASGACIFNGTQPAGVRRGEQIGAKELQGILKARYGDDGRGSLLNCGAPPSKHAEGRAIDWGFDARYPDQLAKTNQAMGWLIANAEAYGIQYIKYWKVQWTPARGVYCVEDKTQQYQHRSHIHIDLNWDGSLKKTSGFTGGGANNSAVKIDQEMCIQLWPQT